MCRAWPLPKIFRLTKGGKLIEGIFKGETINTPSMLAVEDYIWALEWAELQGGLDALIARADANAAALSAWVERTPTGSSISPPTRRRAATPASASNSPSASPASTRRPGARSPRRSIRCSSWKARPTTSPPIATRRRAFASGAAPPSTPPTSRRSAPGSTGPSRGDYDHGWANAELTDPAFAGNEDECPKS